VGDTSGLHGRGVDGIASEHLNHVTDLEVVLANTGTEEGIDIEPPGRLVIDERIVEDFGHFVAERGDVFEAEEEESVGDPARIVHHIAVLPVSVCMIPGLEVVGVKAEDAAGVDIARVEIDVVKQECGDIARCDIAGEFSTPMGVVLSTGTVVGKSRLPKVFSSTAAATGLLLASTKKNQKPKGICMRRVVSTSGLNSMCHPLSESSADLFSESAGDAANHAVRPGQYNSQHDGNLRRSAKMHRLNQ